MLHDYLRPWAVELDEENFRVALRDRIDYDSNRQFQDSNESDPQWLIEIVSVALEKRLRAIDLQPRCGDRFLDVCCGRGYLGDLLQRMYDVDVTSYDMSHKQLTEIRQRNEQALIAEGDLLAMPFRPGSFDVVIGNSFLHHLPDVRRGLVEMRSVLKPGGRLVLLHEPGTHASWWESFPLSLVRDTRPREGFTDLWVFGRSEMQRLLAAAGFRQITVHATGVLSALALNWYLILLGKLGVNRRWTHSPAYTLRGVANALEIRLRRRLSLSAAPSLILVAQK